MTILRDLHDEEELITTKAVNIYGTNTYPGYSTWGSSKLLDNLKALYIVLLVSARVHGGLSCGFGRLQGCSNIATGGVLTTEEMGYPIVEMHGVKCI